MDAKLQNKLLKKYPEVFQINNPPTSPFDSWKFESWDGWYNLIDAAAQLIQYRLSCDKNAYFQTRQNKQKMAQIRWYFKCDEKNQEYFQGIIDTIQALSFSICEKCGTNQNVSQNKKGYILALCDDCRKEHNKEKI